MKLEDSLPRFEAVTVSSVHLQAVEKCANAMPHPSLHVGIDRHGVEVSAPASK
jgi:hypothetical protein